MAALESALDAVVCVDGRLAVLGWNPAAERLLGWGRSVLGRDACELLGAPALRADVACVVTTAGAPLRVEHVVSSGDGTRIDVEATITPADFDGRAAATLFLRDITATKRAERLREVEHHVAWTLAAARSGMEVAPELLEAIGRGMGFEHAEMWLSDRGRSVMRLALEWRRDPQSAFGRAARDLQIRPGIDLAGLAWEIGEPVCIDDVRIVQGLARAEAVRTEGIVACAALPMRVADDILGAVVFARAGGGALDADLRRTLHALCTQIGLFTERRAYERRLQEETAAVAAVARATRELAATVDRQHAADALCGAAKEICDASHTFLAVPDPESDDLLLQATAPVQPAADLSAARFAHDAPSVVMRVFRTGEPVFLPDVAVDPDAQIDRAEEAGVRSALLQPIRRGDEVLGVLGLAWNRHVPRLESSIRLLVRLLADEASLALSRVELFRRLEAAARTDPLTGLSNLRAWDEQLTRELAAARRDSRPVAVAVLDLDGFKQLNDERGHQQGDRVLRSVAAAWQAQLRQGDMLARLGGDEFAVLLPGCRADDALQLAERLRDVTDGATVSIGVAYWDGEEAPSPLRERADAALYAAKAAGRDRVSTG